MDDFFRHAAQESAVLAFLRAGNNNAAIARLKTMLAENPRDHRALALLALIQLSNPKKKEALETAREAAKIAPSDGMVMRVLARALLANGEVKEGEQLAASIVSDNPRDAHALFVLALARLANRDERGVYLLRDVEAHAGDNVNLLLDVAAVRLDQWNYAEAEALAKRAVALDPTQGEAFKILAECAIAGKRNKEAYDLALEALRLWPNNKSVLRLMARARVRQDGLMKPFLPGVDWVLETDRAGFIIMPILALPLIWAMIEAIKFDLVMVLAGAPPTLIVSLGCLALLIYGGVSYFTALDARLAIRRDLKRVALPKF